MELELTVLQVLPEFKTTTQRGEFVKQEVVFEQPGEFSRKICIAFTGDRIQTASQLQQGEKVKVNFNIESREWNGRWFTEVRGWKIERAVAPQQGAYPQYSAPAPQQPQPSYPEYASASAPVPPAGNSSASNPDEAGDLPF